ncbi:helix-turn-helix transcriptional regulator [Namhaeicola litoreus]|uniref:Helix-turn-helix transcriptional regulator n=1 Tax=Namhaeicola litoreus TaxID=1052145 RepID=A0ABW3Y4F5_9FLAO
MKSNNPTLLDFAILGLVKKENLSGYQIRKVFEETAMGNYSSSPGSIYPSLKRLQKLSLVEQKLNEDTRKSQFSITENGLAALKDWMLRPIELSDVQKNLDELLLRFAFMDGLLDEKDVMHFLESLNIHLISHIQNLQEFLQQTEDQTPLHGRLAIDHGIRSLNATLSWSKNVLHLIQK